MRLILVNDVDDPESASWYVDGIIGDHAYRFVLDTGAGLTKMVSDDYLSGFAVKGKKESAGVFAKTKYDLIVVPSLRVGPFVKTDFTIARAQKSGREIKNVLGMNFFVDGAFHFLFETGEMQYVDESQFSAQLEILDLFLGENSHPYVDLSWQGNIRAKGVWDTGAGMTVFDLAFIRRHPHLFKRIGTSAGTDSTGTKNVTPTYEMKEFVLGGKQFPSATVVAVDLSVPNSTIKTPMDFILGYNVLRKANWIFDFRRRKWAISRMFQ